MSNEEGNPNPSLGSVSSPNPPFDPKPISESNPSVGITPGSISYGTKSVTGPSAALPETVAGSTLNAPWWGSRPSRP